MKTSQRGGGGVKMVKEGHPGLSSSLRHSVLSSDHLEHYPGNQSEDWQKVSTVRGRQCGMCKGHGSELGDRKEVVLQRWEGNSFHGERKRKEGERG